MLRGEKHITVSPMNTLRARAGTKDGQGTAAPPAATTPHAVPPGTATPTAEPGAKGAPEFRLEDLQAAVTAAVKTGLDGVDAKLKTAVDGLKLDDLVSAAIKKHLPAPSAEGKVTVTPESIKAAATEAITTAMEGLKAAPQNPRSNSGPLGDDGNRSQIEIPISLSKGNLPVHMKQLLNVIAGKGKRDMNHDIPESLLRDAHKAGDDMLLRAKALGRKAITTTGTTNAADWMNRDLSAELQRRLYLESDIATAFMSTEVQMPTNPYDYPLLRQDGDFFLNTVEGQDALPSDPDAGKFTLSAVVLKGMRQLTDEANEDSIIPLLPELEADLARSAARALENAIINGDTTSTHQDSDVTNPRDARKAWKGFRKLALAVSALKTDISTGGISRANMLAMMKLLGKWGSTRKNDLLWVVGPLGWANLLNLDEFAIWYQRGGATTFADGALPTAPWGGQLAVSEQAREDLNASGVYDGSTTTKGGIYVVYRPAFKLGSRRVWTVELERNARAGTWDIIASFRKAFAPLETPSATVKLVGMGYNYNA